MKKIWGRARRKDANGLTDEQYLRAAEAAAQTEMTEDELLVFPVACGTLRDSRAA